MVWSVPSLMSPPLGSWLPLPLPMGPGGKRQSITINTSSMTSHCHQQPAITCRHPRHWLEIHSLPLSFSLSLYLFLSFSLSFPIHGFASVYASQCVLSSVMCVHVDVCECVCVSFVWVCICPVVYGVCVPGVISTGVFIIHTLPPPSMPDFLHPQNQNFSRYRGHCLTWYDLLWGVSLIGRGQT
jgi:hypothetical protein